MSRVRPVFEWQYGNSNNTAAVGLTFLENYLRQRRRQVSMSRRRIRSTTTCGAAAAAGTSDPNARRPGSVAAIFGSGRPTPSTEGDAIWATAFGLHEMGYEGGFEVGGDTPPPCSCLANLDPSAESEETRQSTSSSSSAAAMPFVFNAAGNTAYGIANPTINEQNTPKMQAILKAIRRTAADAELRLSDAGRAGTSRCRSTWACTPAARRPAR